MAKVFNADAPVMNLPLAIREGGARADFRPDISFDAQVEWHGLRYAWARMTVCPCTPFNDQTKQVRPDCPQCGGLGWRPFRDPRFKIQDHDMGRLDALQRFIINRDTAMVINGVTTSVTSEPNMFSALGAFGLGSVSISVRAENRLGYYDRMTCLDAAITYSELLLMPASGPLKLRYPAIQLNTLMTDTTTFVEGDVTLVDGAVEFVAGKRPAEGTPISACFSHYPAFRVMSYANVFRSSVVRTKRLKTTRTKPSGDVLTYPFRVVARLEHLQMPTT